MATATENLEHAALAEYTEQLFAGEDEVLRDLRAEIARRELPRIHVSPDEGKLLQVLLTATGARRVLEVGTLGGYSAIWMARALPPAADGGRLVTLEIEEDRAELARAFCERAGLGDVVEVRLGAALETLPALAGDEQPFDACFIDADKENYPAYLDWALRLIRPGGLILGDNALRGGAVLDESPADPGTRAIQRFNRRLAEADDLLSTILPIRDGLVVAVVRS